jgi:tetratricopeptide (TPR) repeat protein
MKRLLPFLFVLAACQTPAPTPPAVPDAIAFDGTELFSPEPDSQLVERFRLREADFRANPDDVDALIWYGRFTAYMGDYAEAIAIFSSGIDRWPDDARLYRHRGHRYITTRQLDLAIADLSRAAALIEGSENEVEPDGMPNALGIPVSTLHGNIFYHLGLAHYLNQNMPAALAAYELSLAAGNTPDNVVSNTHWLYTIHRRMGHDAEAAAVLEPITADMEIIENHAYHQLTLFYKGLLSEADLIGEGSAGDAIRYGVAAWHAVEGHAEMALSQMAQLKQEGAWASFGYIAAESDMVHYGW